MSFTARVLAVMCSLLFVVSVAVSAQVTASEQSSFVLHGVRLTGVTVFEQDDLAALLSDVIGQEVGLQDLDGIAAAVTRHYRDAGYPLARAHLPAQTVEDGVVHIAVVEGRYGQLHANNASRLNNDVVQMRLAALAPGDVIDQATLDRTLLLLNDLPGVRVRSSLQPSNEAGYSDLHVRIDDDTPWSGRVLLDNFGNHLTGARRLQLFGDYANPFKMGDRLYGHAMISDGGGLGSGRLGYALTTGTWPLEIDASLARVQYVLGGPFVLLDATGETTTVDVTLRHPWVRTADRTVHVTGGLVSRTSRNLELGQATDKRFFNVLLGVTDTRSLGSADLSWGANVTLGRLTINPASVKQADALGPNTQGGFTKIDGNVRYRQALNDRTQLSATARAQVAFKNLDDSEKMSLGGNSGVKAYPAGEASGDSGFVAGVDVTHVPAWTDAWIGTWRTRAFVDIGAVRTNAKPWPGASGGGRTLFGAGVGVNWSYDGYAVGLDYGCKLGSAVATSAPDAPCRLWVQAGVSF